MSSDANDRPAHRIAERGPDNAIGRAAARARGRLQLQLAIPYEAGKPKPEGGRNCQVAENGVAEGAGKDPRSRRLALSRAGGRVAVFRSITC